MAKTYFCNCHHFNGYTGYCNLKLRNCTRKCKDFQTEEEYYEALAESDVEISLAKLREICLNHTDRLGTLHCSVDLLLKTIKQDLAKDRMK